VNVLKEKTLIVLGRLTCGTAILITSMVTGVDGMYQMIAMLLLGLPVEALKKETVT